jgi:endonuclease YncB( thermonuclease family)
MRRNAKWLGPAFATALMAFPVQAGPSEPVERVIDASTLVIAGETVRLFGIVVPDLDQTCEAGGKPYPCGRIARTGLMDLVVAATLECVPSSADGAAPVVARCRAGGFDLSANMVHTGWARADRVTGTAFIAIEENARAAARGLWRGTFTPPPD